MTDGAGNGTGVGIGLAAALVSSGSALANGRGYYGGHDGEVGLYLLAPFVVYGLWKLLNDRTAAIYGWIILSGVVALGGFYRGLMGAGDGAYLIGIFAFILTMILYLPSRRH